MATELTSAYGGDNLTVSDMMKDPLWIPERVLEELEGAFLEEALFRNGGTNDGVVAYREAAAPFLNDDPEAVAEFAEIPISNLNLGKARTLVGIKTALGIAVSREMKRENRVDMVTRQQTALSNTMRRSGVDASLAAFRAAEVPDLTVTAAWENDAADPMRDIRLAKRMIATAKDPERETALMGYRPDAIVLNEGTLDVALFHEKVQKFYQGNAALENPIYTGITPGILGGLRVVVSEFIPEGEAYVMESGTAGFISDTDPLTVTPMYSPTGENGHGGSTQSWRMDAFRKRIIAVDNPRAVVQLVGIEA
ncbi:hypothetical protein G6031_09610 [Dietzia sp. CQ4]|uniref:phage major capsid protein n=1 Tax=Dietzia sp. (strain CQ4) TaxID=370437 RepID=UPI0015FA8159|nr:hypothetical protein [Dietzia sp. CQ4]MBB1034644.1 hypothetical protein [Dietzia sp. CQ4]